MFNWKIIVGALLSFGSVNEIIEVHNQALQRNFSPLSGYIAGVILIVAGLFLIKKGWAEKQHQ